MSFLLSLFSLFMACDLFRLLVRMFSSSSRRDHFYHVYQLTSFFLLFSFSSTQTHPLTANQIFHRHFPQLPFKYSTICTQTTLSFSVPMWFIGMTNNGTFVLPQQWQVRQQSNQGIRIWLVSLALLAPAGRCHNYTIWVQMHLHWSPFKGFLKALKNMKCTWDSH